MCHPQMLRFFYHRPSTEEVTDRKWFNRLTANETVIFQNFYRDVMNCNSIIQSVKMLHVVFYRHPQSYIPIETILRASKFYLESKTLILVSDTTF